jgi:hypothetical protein
LPYSAYYGALRTSPEEVGLSYIELLAQSTLAVVLLAAGGTVLIIFTTTGMSYFYLVYLLIRIVMAGSFSAVPKERFYGEWLEQDYVAVERAKMQYVRDRLPSMEQYWSNVYARERRRRELASLPTRTPNQQVEYEDLSRKNASPSEKKELNHQVVREVLRVAARMAPIVFVCAVIATILVLTLLFAPRDAARVRHCENPILGKFGLSGIRGERVIITGPDVANLGLATGRLMLLGQGDKGYVFYNCDHDQTVRTSGTTPSARAVRPVITHRWSHEAVPRVPPDLVQDRRGRTGSNGC